MLDDADVFVSLDPNTPGVHVTKGDRGTRRAGLLFDQVGAPAVGPVVTVPTRRWPGRVQVPGPDPSRPDPHPGLRRGLATLIHR